MANKKRKQGHSVPSTAESKDQTLTLKDLLGTETVSKLKAHAEQLKQEETSKQEKIRQEAEASRLNELKLKENDFEYLLNNSSKESGKYM
jgi:C4-type Zn-finger protein